MRSTLLLPLLLAALAAYGQSSASEKNLRIYAIDVEGGKSTLFVSPSGQTMLIDTGYDGNNNRDASRIVAAMKQAGVDHIDHLVLTHYHKDHAGGIRQLAALVRIDRFYDHGPSVEAGLDDTWKQIAKEHTALRPGDTVPIEGMEVRVVAAAGKSVQTAGAANPSCTAWKPVEEDPGENARSVAMVVTYGKFRVADLGDLHWNREFDIACPNRLGTVDLYLTTHHGTATSGSPQMLAALRPRVAVMNNGATKGGSQKALQTMRASKGLQDIWQLHFSEKGELNSEESLIANPKEECEGKGIRITASADGSFRVRNDRNGFEKAYPAIN